MTDRILGAGRLLAVLALGALTACVEVEPDRGPAPQLPPQSSGPTLAPAEAARNFSIVVARMEPLVEQECRARSGGQGCDFKIVVDTTAGAPPNAFQTRDKSGRPVIAFTQALIADARNADELAFVMGHEAAHHILDHIPRQQETAVIGGTLSGVLAAALGGDPQAIETAQKIGATVGARSYSKDFELEADRLGTVLAYRAGYDPVLGAAFFSRLPDPGDSFLGTHPPNNKRIAMVRRTVDQLQGG
ncbi:MAG: M48 family metalloprotease [Paracoccaceae bacterium]